MNVVGRFIGLESKQQQGEGQFRAKCEKEKVFLRVAESVDHERVNFNPT